MPIEQSTLWPTEADFEADLQAVISRAFPWLPSGAIRHQTIFSFTWGRATIQVDGREQTKANARADVLLYSGDQPLAVVELKRPGHAIDQSDIDQGLSYARMLHPRPPLVVVANGSDDPHLLETHTGSPWKPDDPTQSAFASLLSAATHVAAEELKRAVEILMGSNATVWLQAVRATSRVTLTEMAGDWNDPLRPFVPDFLIPRKAAAVAWALMKEGKRLVFIEGPPLSGKSNVLREITLRADASGDLAVLFVDAEAGAGVYRTVASALADALAWPITDDEARTWLMRLSKSTGPSLVIAVDGLSIDRETIRDEITDLTSHLFGERLCVMVSLDDTLADRVVLNSTGRKQSAIGRRASRIEVGALDEDEFRAACGLLEAHHIGIMRGGEKSPELRLCWVLRAIASQIAAEENHTNRKLIAGVPPLLGLDLIVHARATFRDAENRRLLREIARAVLRDAEDRKRTIALILISMATYVVRRKTLQQELSHSEIEKLVAQGILRQFVPDTGDAILVVRTPELLASEAAIILSDKLAAAIRSDARAAAKDLVTAAESMPLGDIIAAHAILDTAHREGGLPLSLVMQLIELKPEQHPVKPGTRAAMYFPGIGAMEVTFERDGSILVNASGERIPIQEAGSDDVPKTITNIHSWLILSHLASRPFAMEENGATGARVDPMIMTEVGTCPIVLRAVAADPDMAGVLTHHTDEGEVVCERAGMVEPITVAMFNFFASVGSQAEEWLDLALERNSFPFLMRIHTALDQLAGSADVQSAGFARRMLDEKVLPALGRFPSLH